MMRLACLLALTATLLFTAPAWGGESKLSLNSVLHIVLNNHPDLALARIQEQSLHIERQNIEGILDPRISLAGSLSDETTPTTSPFAPSGNSIRLLSGNITKLLTDGATLKGSFNYSRTKVSYPGSVPTFFQATINPTYQQQIDLIYRYPLLRGHGNPTYNEQITSNQFNEQAARWQVAIQQEQLAAQAIRLYYQIASNVIAKKLAKEAVLRANKLLNYQKKRQQFGLIDDTDRRQTEALLASHKMTLANAKATLNSSITALNRLMLRDATQPIQPNINVTSQTFKIAPIQTWLEQAKQQRPIFHMLDAQLAANDATLILNHDQHDTQVDLIAQVGSRSLSGSAGYTFGQGFTLNDRFISIGVELNDTLGGKSTQAAILKTELERERIHLLRKQAIENIETALSNALTFYHNGKMIKAASKLHEQAEQIKFTTELKRYRDGRSDTATLIQFEGDLRNAELQAALQDIQIQLSKQQIELATGNLLKDLDITP
ncbi:MAG: TolC family protein [Mariprofundaceae bacterium]|nr:TolC family protein [Mariprofundaceae bacterium]